MKFCDLVQNKEFRAIFEKCLSYFSKKNGNTAWEYRKDRMDQDSSGESAQIRKNPALQVTILIQRFLLGIFLFFCQGAGKEVKGQEGTMHQHGIGDTT